VNETPAAGNGSGAATSVLDAQVEALLERIAVNRERRCAQLRASMEIQARDLLRAARKEALADVRAATARERKHAELALQQAVAAAALETRQRAQRATHRMLTVMWAAIADALEARWADAANRKAWLEAAIRQAQSLLSERSWRVEHGADWSELERGALAALAAGGEREPARAVVLSCDPTVRAGIRIRTTGACLDATVTGLLASRSQIESEFLAQFVPASMP